MKIKELSNKNGWFSRKTKEEIDEATFSTPSDQIELLRCHPVYTAMSFKFLLKAYDVIREIHLDYTFQDRESAAMELDREFNKRMEARENKA